MNDTIVSLIRTYVPIVVGAVIAWICRKLGIVEPDTTALATAFTVVVIALYYGLARLLEKRWPSFGVLLGVPKEPNYTGTPPPP